MYGVRKMKIVSYLRVSTVKQGHSCLGLEAQRAAIGAFATSRKASVSREFVEIESGQATQRPQLKQALHLAKVTGSTLVIAKLDRLSRNAAFLLALRDSGAQFVAADMPDANDLTVGIMALVAQQEREAISKRTKEALAAAKARGTRLGNPRGAAALRRAGKGNVGSLAAIQLRASSHASNLVPVIEQFRSCGIASLRALAHALNQDGMLTPRGGKWHASSVRNLLRRIDGQSIASTDKHA